jgi:hypothetical protein
MATTETVKRQDEGVNTRLTLSALWTTVMFLYVYADLFAFFDPKSLRRLMDGTLLPFPITQAMMLGFAVTMSIPTVMIFASLVLKANRSRWFNIVVGVVYTLIAAYTMAMPSSLVYRYFESLEILFTGYIVWAAWKWPVKSTADQIPSTADQT